MLAVFLDLCFLLCHNGDKLDGVAALLVDDTLMTGTASFAEAERNMHNDFDM
jgi:hypothetical protein